jgi:hypothetical protein
MVFRLANLELFAPRDVEHLLSAGVATSADLLERAANREQREALASCCGVPPEALVRFVRMADLMRITGINEAHTQLLDAVGAGCIADLVARDAPTLIKAMRRKNVELTLVRSVPPESTLARWIADARLLPIVLED